MGFLKGQKRVAACIAVLLLAFLFFAEGTGIGHALQGASIPMVVSKPKVFDLQEEAGREAMSELRQNGGDIFSVEQPEDIISLPADVQIKLKYTNHMLPEQYVLSKKADVHVRQMPGTDGKSLKKTYRYERFEYIEIVQSVKSDGTAGDKWVHVSWIENGVKKFGFIHDTMAIIRTFRFSTMYGQIDKLEKEFNKNKISYINNYKDMTSRAPAWYGKNVDKFGNTRYQSAPGYESLPAGADFRYVRDGSLLSVLSKKSGFYQVKVLTTGKTCWVPEKYIPAWKKIGPLSKVIVIDLKNQNEVLFEKEKDHWVIVSYTLATTGAKAEYKSETPPGSYYVIEKRDKFDYLDDVTREVAGYAPYAVRFTGGAYIHGVPVSYQFKNGKRVDPGMQEESRTLGTVPLSHQCVRNYTSHAKFVREWTDLGKTAVIVIQ